MSTIFILTASTTNFTKSRVFGYYFTVEKALEAAKQNYGGMEECLYDYLIIESMPEGIHAQAQIVFWFCWDQGQSAWMPSPIPKEAENLSNFGIG